MVEEQTAARVSLSDQRIKSLPPGKYKDGSTRGLYLQVVSATSKSWVLRVVVNGKRRHVGLGSWPIVTLKAAREEALELHRAIRQGLDPVLERHKIAKRKSATFRAIAEECFEIKRVGFGGKHRQQWLNSLKNHAFQLIGDIPVGNIDAPDLLKVVRPLWTTKHETATRVLQRCGVVLDYARAHSMYDKSNPVDAVRAALPLFKAPTENYEAMPFGEVPALMEQLSAKVGNSARALEFAILTASRTAPVLAMEWQHLDGELWVCPPEIMKTAREHVVPLSPRALEIVRVQRERFGHHQYVFPGKKAGHGLSDMALLMMLRKMGVPFTTHGFRSSFKDWARELSGFPDEVSELCLAHTVGNQVWRAYARSTLLNERKKLMILWGEFLASSTP